MRLWALTNGDIIQMFKTAEQKIRGQLPFRNLQALTTSDMIRAGFLQTLTESIE
jgi:hypothetical protein